jgi:hypothetical protein
MTTEQAFIEGFVKRANQHGLSDQQAIELFKEASPVADETLRTAPGAVPVGKAGNNPLKSVKPAAAPGVSNITEKESKRLNIPAGLGGYSK